jgi:hypothetical protein
VYWSENVSSESGEGDEDDDKDQFPGSTKLEWIWEESGKRKKKLVARVRPRSKRVIVKELNGA